MLNSAQPVDYGLFVLLGVTASILIVGAAARVFNFGITLKCFGCYLVDNGRWSAVLMFGLQFYDWWSDLNLCRFIWYRADVFSSRLVLISAMGSSFFVAMPFVVNLFIAANIKQLIRGNPAAVTWFESRATLFCVLVVFTGGCYPALSLLSSNVFGSRRYTSSGLTQFELAQLDMIRVVNVILENIPQIAFQCMYFSAVGEIDDEVAFAFVASLLSVVVTTLSWIIQRKDGGTVTVSYYLLMRCARKGLASNCMMTPFDAVSPEALL